ncbi:MAG: Tryptophan-tRNA ligase [Candidatus Woesebacteria bacterium GW2011_GWA1_39_8]|uniref:Tryptophan--tRNA ligase n=2 Tax=Candidatus Woeseibacteriota TaxID=1752722 RepID=A0A0G0PQC8_9BACT|nr:MAG: Tryptophan-tRNA ligase [Candidatus Woesebacteria bacterium GW2011_GWA1_39_8]
MKEKIEKILIDANVEFEFIPLPEDLAMDVPSHMKFYGDTMEHALATMIYKTENGFIAVSRRGDSKVNSKKLRESLGIKRLSFATEEDLASLGLTPGLVPPLGHSIPLYLDKKLLDVDYFYDGTGHKLFGLKMKTEDLLKVNSAKIGDFTAKEEHHTIERVLSGITPSGSTLHLGNYAGAVKPQFDLLEKGVESYYFVADLHALTTIQNREKLERCIISNVFDYIALGLDPQKGIYFRQSDVAEHSMLAIVLANYIPFGLTNRMHAFKDKLAKGVSKESINMGLFNYPILMAADILLYKPSGVPVGEDQRQHVEFARETARFFNIAHGETFPIPEPLIQEGNASKVVGTDGERKMSKSLGNIINIFDDEEVIRRQIVGSYTDPNRKHATDPGNVEGNPIFIYHDIVNDDKDEVENLKRRYREGKVGDVEVKEKLFEAHKRKFSEARRKRRDLENDIELAKEILEKGAEKARKVAKETMREVYRVVGITNKLSR